MKMITHYTELKPGYLYQLKDQVAVYIMLFNYIQSDTIRGDLISSTDTNRLEGDPENYFEMGLGIVSLVPAEHVNFSSSEYEIQEIGLKSKYPEYLL